MHMRYIVKSHELVIFACGSMNHTYETLPMSIHMWAIDPDQEILCA